MKPRIAVDQDQVLADLLGYWLDLYNNDYNDNLYRHEVTGWDIEKYVKPECGLKIYDYLNDPQTFYNLPVIEYSQDVLRELNEYFEIFVVTSPWNMNNVLPKYKWLKKHFSFLDEHNFVFTKNKSIINTYALIDDSPKNLETFGGRKVLFDAPHNHKESRFTRASDWLKARDILLPSGKIEVSAI